jgi:hypothetical protein
MNSHKLLEEGRKDELWTKYCGFFNLSLDEYMGIQKRLMLEQIKLLSSSKIGRILMGNKTPSSIDEYRQIVPLTTYADYRKLLSDKNEDILPVKPFVWARTTGRTSSPKWVPYTKTMYDHLADPVIGAMLMSSCSYAGEVRLERNDKLLLATAPPPYASAYISRATQDQLSVKFFPPLEEGEKMEYGQRVAAGFRLAMEQGLDYFMGLASVLARMGEQFEQQSSSIKASKEMLKPSVLWRLVKAMVKAKLNNRNILPKDIWKLKGIMSGGTDTEISREKIEYYWGKKPLEGYACTEGGNMAAQGWNFKGMVFYPDNAFLEFIPFDEHLKNKADPSYQLKTLLYDELQVGIYELVFSNLHGGVLVRYRIGDLFEVISLGDKELKSPLPQLKFFSYAEDLIDIASLVRLTEREIWKAIHATGIKYQDWLARKEIQNNEPVLHVYVEPKPRADISPQEFKKQLDRQLSDRIPDFRDAKEMLGRDLLRVTMLPIGCFDHYIKLKQQQGADLAHIKPPHMQPPEDIVRQLKSFKIDKLP